MDDAYFENSMRLCNNCSSTSPSDANYCINCGAAFQAWYKPYTEETHRLRTHQPSLVPSGAPVDAPLYVPRYAYRMLLCQAGMIHMYDESTEEHTEAGIKTGFYYLGREVIIVDD